MAKHKIINTLTDSTPSEGHRQIHTDMHAYRYKDKLTERVGLYPTRNESLFLRSARSTESVGLYAVII